MLKATIIGAGISSIAMSIRLAVKGYKVTVIEQDSVPGGKIAEYHQDGFRFDMGPSLFTMPEFVDELFELAGEDPGQKFKYKKLEVVTKYFFEDQTELVAYSDPLRFAGEIEEKTGENSDNVINYLEKSRELYEITKDVFIRSSLHDISNYFSNTFMKAYGKLHKLNAFYSMHSVNSKWFDDERIVSLFDRFATYNGSNPFSAPATLNVIPHLEHNIGAYFPEKGMYNIVGALCDLALRQGVTFRFNSKVNGLAIEKNSVRAVKTSEGDISSDIVVSGIDVYAFYKNILPDVKRVRTIEKQERSTSALIFYWGIDKEFPGLDMHNILFSNDYYNEFQHLFDKRTWFEDPTVYIFISSKMVIGDAPGGKENWFVMINVPENTGQDWMEFARKARESIIKKINRVLRTDIEQEILFEKVLDPVGIEERTSSYRGSLYGSSSNSRFSAFRRHANFSRSVRGLYFTGGSVHPGGGIPLCLSSAAIVDKRISKNN